MVICKCSCRGLKKHRVHSTFVDTFGPSAGLTRRRGGPGQEDHRDEPDPGALRHAKTFRNPNSSRFGKFMKLQFNENGKACNLLAGGKTYLLQKSCLVFQMKGERNYHVFYQVFYHVFYRAYSHASHSHPFPHSCSHSFPHSYSRSAPAPAPLGTATAHAIHAIHAIHATSFRLGY